MIGAELLSPIDKLLMHLDARGDANRTTFWMQMKRDIDTKDWASVFRKLTNNKDDYDYDTQVVLISAEINYIHGKLIAGM